jgi:hypothetical protein
MLQYAEYATKNEGHGWLHSRNPLATHVLGVHEMVDVTIAPTVRVCIRCNQEKTAEEFFSDPRRKGRTAYLRSRCKDCTKADVKTARAKRGDIIRRQERDSQRRNYPKNGHVKRLWSLKWRLKNKFGLTVEQFFAMLEEQGNACATCRRFIEPVASGRSRFTSACVDHDHTTGKIRGLLCNPCNLAIGYLEEDAERLDALAAYLRKHRNE